MASLCSGASHFVAVTLALSSLCLGFPQLQNGQDAPGWRCLEIWCTGPREERKHPEVWRSPQEAGTRCSAELPALGIPGGAALSMDPPPHSSALIVNDSFVHPAPDGDGATPPGLVVIRAASSEYQSGVWRGWLFRGFWSLSHDAGRGQRSEKRAPGRLGNGEAVVHA